MSANPVRFLFLFKNFVSSYLIVSCCGRFNRALLVDIPLIPLVFIVMSAFTTLVFYKRDRLYSRSFLGFCGVVSVLLSLVAGYGLMFVCGVTLTSMTQVSIVCSLKESSPSSFDYRGAHSASSSPHPPVYCIRHWARRCFHSHDVVRPNRTGQGACRKDCRYCG